MPQAPRQISFQRFLSLTWVFLGLPPPTPLQKDIANVLETAEHPFLCIQAFRGAGKTWILAVYCLWRLYANRDLKILAVSANSGHAGDFTSFLQQLLRSHPVLKHMAPQPALGDRYSALSFDVTGASASPTPSVRAAGVMTNLTGKRADLILCDDVESPLNSESALQRQRLRGRVAELAGAILTPEGVDKGGGVVFLGTPQSDESLYSGLPEIGYKTYLWPSEGISRPLPASVELGPVAAATEPGQPTEPTRFSALELERRRLEYGPFGYAMQFLLDPAPRAGSLTPLKLQDLILMDTDPEVAPERVVWGGEEFFGIPMVGLPGDRWRRPAYVAERWDNYQASLMYIDPAGRGKDETGYVVLKALNGTLYIRRWGGLSGGFEDETLAFLARTAAEEKVNEICVENNFGDGMYVRLLAPYVKEAYQTPDGTGCHIEEERVTGNKFKRILQRLEGPLDQHRVVIDARLAMAETQDKTAVKNEETVYKNCLYQLTRVTAEKGCIPFDDRIEALAGAVHRMGQHVGVSAEEAVQRAAEQRFEEELEKMRLAAEGLQRQPKTWGGPSIDNR